MLEKEHPSRMIRNSYKDFSHLAVNERYKFSRQHALSIYAIDAVFSYIPKNACTSLRFSCALANGYVSDISHVNWIHKNNDAFIASKYEIRRASCTFVVLRCPYARIFSAFFDKLVGGEVNVVEQGIVKDMTFRSFVSFVNKQAREDRNHHWRNQVDFLLYEEYDHYFCLEKFDDAIITLRSLGFDVVDTRSAVGHDTGALEKLGGELCDVPISELAIMKRRGQVPTLNSMYDPAVFRRVSEIYADDIELYISHFGSDNMFCLNRTQ